MVALERCAIWFDKKVFEIPNDVGDCEGRIVDFFVELGTLSAERVLRLPR